MFAGDAAGAAGALADFGTRGSTITEGLEAIAARRAHAANVRTTNGRTLTPHRTRLRIARAV